MSSNGFGFSTDFSAGRQGISAQGGIAIGLGLLVLIIVGVLGWYFYNKKKHSKNGSKSTNMLAKGASKSGKSSVRSSHGGQFQPAPTELKAQFKQDKDEQQFAESLQAGFAQRLAGINDVGLMDENCTGDMALGPDGGKGQRVEIHNLVPNSWRDPKYRAAEDACTENVDTNWAAHAPTPKQFKTFIRASGIAAFSTSDHILNPTGRIDALLRTTNPPAPTSGRAHFMNDSEARQSALADTLGDLESVADIQCL